MLRWWKTNEKRTVLAVRPVDERTVQIIRKGPFLVECAVVVDGEAVAAFGAGPAWLQASGRAANRAISLQETSEPRNPNSKHIVGLKT